VCREAEKESKEASKRGRVGGRGTGREREGEGGRERQRKEENKRARERQREKGLLNSSYANKFASGVSKHLECVILHVLCINMCVCAGDAYCSCVTRVFKM